MLTSSLPTSVRVSKPYRFYFKTNVLLWEVLKTLSDKLSRSFILVNEKPFRSSEVALLKEFLCF